MRRLLSDLVRVEAFFLCALLVIKTIVFIRFLGLQYGYDAAEHLLVVENISWAKPFLPLNFSLYSWHPPLGFLFARTVMDLGIPMVAAAQTVSFIAVLIGFFFMRQTLKALGVLFTTSGILFLYIGASIPMQVYLQFFVSLDVLVLGLTSASIFFAIRIFWLETSRNQMMIDCVLFLLVTMIAIFSKTTGILLLSLPLLAALISPRGISKRSLILACGLGAIGILLIVPYSYLRIYLSGEGMLIPTERHSVWTDKLTQGRIWRWQHPFLWLANFVAPVEGRSPQLFYTWQSFWMLSAHEMLTLTGFIIGIIYTAFMPLPLIGGGIRAIRTRFQGPLGRLGLLLIILGSIQFAALLWYMWSLPIPGYFSNKGLYIASTCWLIAFVLTMSAEFVQGAAKRFLKDSMIHTCTFAVVMTFLLINHLVPVA